MRKGIGIILVAGLGLGVGVAVASAGSDISAPVTFRVIEHAKTDSVVDLHPSGDSSGDLLTFHNPVYGAGDRHRVGHDQGTCIREAPKKGTWQCSWTTFLSQGQITVEGPFYDRRDSVLAVIGGTGNYRNARGQMVLKSRKGGSEFAFIFQLLP